MDLQSVEELLEETRQGYTPLERAQLEEAVADADFQVQEAQEVLDDTREPYTEQQIQTQEEMLADARVALRDALDSLAAASPDNRLRYTEAVQLRATTGAELEAAQRVLAEFEINHAQLLAEAIQAKADWEVTLEEANVALQGYEDRTLLLNQWRSEKEEAQEKLENSQQKLADLRAAEAETGGFQSHIRQREEFVEMHLDSFVQAQENVAKVEQLEADLSLAQASINSTKEELARLELGPDPLDRRELEAAVQLAEADLLVAEESLSSQRLEVDPLDASLLESQVTLAQATVAQAEEDLEELLQGADSLEVVLRETQLRTAQAALSEAQEDLTELLAKPEPVELALAEAEVAAVKQKLEDANTRLTDSTLRAPFAGLVAIVHVEEGDQLGPGPPSWSFLTPPWLRWTG